MSCHVKCPGEFKYAQEGGGSGPLVEKCVIANDNSYSVSLVPLPGFLPDRGMPEYYAAESERFRTELNAVRARYISQRPVQDAIASARFENSERSLQYQQIQSEYASYTSAGAATKQIEDVMQRLKPLRAKTAPAEDLSLERRKLLTDRAPSMLLLQICLFLLFVCLLVYAFAPMPYANYGVFLLLSTGVAIGIFLTK